MAKTWTYNQRGLVSETQPESGTVSYTYDALGRVATRTDALSHVTTYTYDSSNRIVGVTTPWNAAYNAAVQYDASGSRTSASNAYVTSQFEYDAGSRLTRRIDEITGHRFETSFGYDANDNLTDLWYPSGNRVTYDYDSNNRLVRVYDTERGLEFARDFVYRPSGAVASYTSGNGIVNAVQYNDVEQPTHIGSSGGVVDLSYTYDDAGHVTGIADPRPGQSATYAYDALSRLLTATGPWGTLTYVYDSIGNRTSSTLNATTTAHTYSATTNRLLSSIRDGQQYRRLLP